MSDVPPDETSDPELPIHDVVLDEDELPIVYRGLDDRMGDGTAE